MVLANNDFFPIIIYQMGKVGSSTIKRSLNHAYVPNKIEYVHFLSWSSIKSIEKNYLKQNKQIPSHILQGKRLRQKIDQSLGHVRFKVISLVRDPVARDISDVFQNIERDIPHVLNLNKQQATEEVLKHILNILNQFDEKIDYACNWFDKEIKDVFEFDIFSNEFDKNQGYQIYSTKYSDILILRLENLSACHKKAFKEFLGIPNFTLLHDNTGKNKWYSEIYDQILKEIDISDYVLDKIYHSRYASHFYTKKECIDFKKKWNQNNCLIQKNAPKLDRPKILFIHPEGNILGNPNFNDIIEILCENNIEVHIFAAKKKTVIQKAPCKESRLFLFNTQEDPSVSDCFTVLAKHSFISESSALDYIKTNVANYDFVIGIDRGIIEAELISRAKRISYGLISYEIFFEEEAGAKFKEAEIRACKNIEFAVVQDNVRAKFLSQENKIPLSKMIYIPVAGRSTIINIFEKKYVIHDALGLDKSKKIVLFIGSIAYWTMADFIIESTRFWPDDWVLVINNRYKNDLSNPYYAKYNQQEKVFFLSHPAEQLSQLENILLSADMGVALYRPIQGSIGCGNNIKNIGMSSGKIGVYLKYGLPVITNDIGEMSSYISKYKLGIVIDTKKPLLINFSSENIIFWKKKCVQFFNDQLDLNKTIRIFFKSLKRAYIDKLKKNEIDSIIVQSEQEFQIGNISKSLQLLLMITDKFPDHPIVLNNLGVIHWKIGERNQGIKYLKKALYKDEQNSIIISNLRKMQINLNS
ncbi:family 2 glycosyl transferase [Candidatus Magnetomorum sp. HK-1]|nr:family 2 glycosyl transferase [Candidatus Magnetomorum sp. HK-1]